MGFARGPTRPRGAIDLLGAGKRRAPRAGRSRLLAPFAVSPFAQSAGGLARRRASDGRRPPHRANNLSKRAKARLAKEDEVYIKSAMRATKLRLAGGLGKTSGLESAACPFCYNCGAFAGEGPSGKERFDRPGRLFACLGASRGGASLGGPNPGMGPCAPARPKRRGESAPAGARAGRPRRCAPTRRRPPVPNFFRLFLCLAYAGPPSERRFGRRLSLPRLLGGADCLASCFFLGFFLPLEAKKGISLAMPRQKGEK